MISLRVEFSVQARKLMKASGVSEQDILDYLKDKEYIVGGTDIVSFIENKKD